MKKILITGKNSYIGNKFEEWMSKYPNEYKVDNISLRDEAWKDKDFSKYDVIYHTVGIAHIKETKENRELYFKINRDLAYEVAKKSKDEGVKQFIFLSTMSVYGLETGIIDKNTPLKPNNSYGKSKLEAEKTIILLEDESFKVAIVRPPMVYGKGCKGNYPRLAKLALNTPIFPKVDNQRSMIYIDNLSEFIRILIDDTGNGLFLPQNKDYVNTSEMVKLIAKTHGKTIILTKLFNPLLRLLNISTINKVFGDLVYVNGIINGAEILISNHSGNETISFEESIRLTETKGNSNE